MSHGKRISEGDAELLAWMRGNGRLAARVTVISFALAAVVGFLLVIAQQLLQGGDTGKARLMGLPIDVSPITSAGYSLPLLVIALGAWMMLSSLSRLIVARQVRDHLRTLNATPPATDRANAVEIDAADDGDEDSAEGGDTMAERMLIESYLSILSGVARTLAISLVLALALPLDVIPGLVLAWIVTSMIAIRRYRRGQAIQDQMRDASANWRKEGTRASHDSFVDAIYLRDTSMQRLTLGEAMLLLGAILVAVVLPAWFSSDSSSATSMVLLLIWMQGLLHAATEAASLGWRWAHKLRLRDFQAERAQRPRNPREAREPRPPRPAHQQPQPQPQRQSPQGITVITAVPPAWPRSGTVWQRVAADAPTLILLPGSTNDVAGTAMRQVASHLWRCGVNLLVLREKADSDTSSAYPGLGDDMAEVASSLGRLVDLSTTVVLAAGEGRGPAIELSREATVRRCVVFGASEPVEGVVALAEQPTPGAWPAARRVDALLGLWFDPDRTDDDVQEASRRLFEAAFTGAEPQPAPRPQEA